MVVTIEGKGHLKTQVTRPKTSSSSNQFNLILYIFFSFNTHCYSLFDFSVIKAIVLSAFVVYFEPCAVAAAGALAGFTRPAGSRLL